MAFTDTHFSLGRQDRLDEAISELTSGNNEESQEPVRE
jgi:hypothetical protein